jgi:DNA end-binding protein Ku
MARNTARAPEEDARDDQEEEEGESPGVRPFWSGTLSFGLVSIPVDLYRGTRPGGVAFRMLAPDGAPLARVYVCPNEGTVIPRDELVRGYEHAPGEHVIVSDEELEALEPKKSRDIDLRLFVPEGAIDPFYFERPFYLAPSGDSTKAYRLLASTMERQKRVGIATFVMHGKENLVAIMGEKGLLRAQTLRFAGEVRSPEDVGLPKKTKVDQALVKSFERWIGKLDEAELDPEELRDENAERVQKLAEKKEKSGKGVVEAQTEAPEPASAQIIDLMEVLKKSLEGDKPSAKPSAQADEAPKKRAGGGKRKR